MNINVPISSEALSAMKTLVEAGVSDEAIGRALRDLLLGTDGERTPTRGGSRRMEVTAPDNRSATGTPNIVSEPRPESASAIASAAAPPSPATSLAGMVPLKVRFSTGKASNVSIPAKLLNQVSVKLGGLDAARQRVRDLAKQIPEEASNRSGLIQASLNSLLD